MLPVNEMNKTFKKILNNASELFAEKGYEGTIMDELCIRSGVNKASIYYHFKDKSNLYEVVLTKLFSEVADQIIVAVSSQTAPLEQLKSFIETFAQETYQNKQMPATLMREIASGGKNMPIPARKQMQRILQTLSSILKEGAEQQVFKQVDPLTTHFIIIGSLCFFSTSEPMRQAIESEHPLDPDLNSIIAEIYSLISSAIILN